MKTIDRKKEGNYQNVVNKFKSLYEHQKCKENIEKEGQDYEETKKRSSPS